MLVDWLPLLESRKLPAICGLYVIRNKLNGKEYVGKSVNVRKRMTSHRQMASPHTFHRALRKYGLENFEVCILAAGTDAEMLALEITTIAKRKTFGTDGYNATTGGDGAPDTVWTDEMRARVSKRFKGSPWRQRPGQR